MSTRDTAELMELDIAVIAEDVTEDTTPATVPASAEALAVKPLEKLRPTAEPDLEPVDEELEKAPERALLMLLVRLSNLGVSRTLPLATSATVHHSLLAFVEEQTAHTLT